MTTEVEEFFAEVRPPLRAVAVALRTALLGVLPECPEADEIVDFGNRLLSYRLNEGGVTEEVFAIRPCRGYVELRVTRGAVLEDPGRLLAGAGTGPRHRRVHTLEEAAPDGLIAVLRQAVEQTADSLGHLRTLAAEEGGAAG